MPDLSSHEIALHRLNDSPELRVLIEDDSRSLRRVLKRELSRIGIMSTDTAQNGLAAIQALRRETFDLMLLDIEMPMLDGINVLKIVKEDPKLQHIPIIIISGFDYCEQSMVCMQLGAEYYLPKPFNVMMLRTQIFSAIAKTRR